MPAVKRDRMSFRIEAIVGKMMKKRVDDTRDDDEAHGHHRLVRAASMYVPRYPSTTTAVNRFPSNATTLSVPSSTAPTLSIRQHSTATMLSVDGESRGDDYDYRYEFLKAEVEELVEEMHDLRERIVATELMHLQAEADALVVKTHELQQKMIAALV
jgi:serine/threonine protein kinase HipA of HipAB toxin-antitoxin module